MKPWKTIETAPTGEGILSLLQRGDDDFLIKLDNYVLMNSRLSLSERVLARSACRSLDRGNPSVLVGGLGMGCTLRAALDALPATARVVVAELNPVVVRWCGGPLRELTSGAVDDPRVKVEIADVAHLISRAATGKQKFDAIILDLYQGTHEANSDPEHPFYGRAALRLTRQALSPGGVFAAWTEDRDVRFESRLASAGFRLEEPKRASSGPRHVVYLGFRL